MEMLASSMVVIILQFISVSSQHVHFKLTHNMICQLHLIKAGVGPQMPLHLHAPRLALGVGAECPKLNEEAKCADFQSSWSPGSLK